MKNGRYDSGCPTCQREFPHVGKKYCPKNGETLIRTITKGCGEDYIVELGEAEFQVTKKFADEIFSGENFGYEPVEEFPHVGKTYHWVGDDTEPVRRITGVDNGKYRVEVREENRPSGQTEVFHIYPEDANDIFSGKDQFRKPISESTSEFPHVGKSYRWTIGDQTPYKIVGVRDGVYRARGPHKCEIFLGPSAVDMIFSGQDHEREPVPDYHDHEYSHEESREEKLKDAIKSVLGLLDTNERCKLNTCAGCREYTSDIIRKLKDALGESND